MTITIRPATEHDREQIPALFAEAFSADPVWAAIVPNPSARARMIPAEIGWQIDPRRGHLVDAAVQNTDTQEAGNVLGALITEPPATGRQDSPGVGERLVEALTALAPMGRRGNRHQSAVDAHRPDGPHWYLHDIAASAAARGQGIGTRLLAHRLNLVDDTGLPVFLEATTAASARLYARFGFETIATVTKLPGTRSFVMIRPANPRDTPDTPGTAAA